MLLERVGADRFMLVDDRMLDWIASRIPQVGSDHDWRGRASAVGCVIKGEIVAGMACMNWDKKHRHIEIAFAADSPRWASRQMIGRFMAWPLVRLDCQRITALVVPSNRPVIKLLQGMGFKEEGLLRRGLGGNDALILGLLREEISPWLERELTALAVAPTNEIA
jgi:RimJ/RimL family protein N-acetyltransferase